jgi:hypothetical protein
VPTPQLTLGLSYVQPQNNDPIGPAQQKLLVCVRSKIECALTGHTPLPRRLQRNVPVHKVSMEVPKPLWDVESFLKKPLVKKPLIKECDLPAELKQDAVDICLAAVEKHASTDLEHCAQVR